MIATKQHCLDGLEPDNLLAFLALLGLLRALEAADSTLRPRVAWDLDQPPLRPRLILARALAAAEISELAAKGIESIAASYDFDGRKDLNYSREDCREFLKQEVETSSNRSRARVDLLASLMSDAAVKDDKVQTIDPTPLCLLFGQGHQHFLERLSNVPRQAEPPRRGRGKTGAQPTAAECVAEALFETWQREDDTFSFRWDPIEDVRYALMAGDPTDGAYKTRTQHGANRLAAIGLAALTLAPEQRAGRVRPAVLGGKSGREGFSFAWPIWRDPASLTSIVALLSHPGVRKAGALEHLGVEHVVVASRISVGKFMNFTRARLLLETESEDGGRSPA